MHSSIAVIVPVFNRAAAVLAALDTIAQQTCLPARLVVVDDGSTERCAALVGRWLETQTARVDSQWICQSKSGPSGARNRGLAEVRNCAFVAFLDSEDRWPHDFLERAASALEGCSAAVAASCDREFFLHKRRSLWTEDLAPLAEAPVEWLLRHGAGVASATLFRRAAIDVRGGFDERLSRGQDSALFLSLCLDGPWLHVPGLPVRFDCEPVPLAGACH